MVLGAGKPPPCLGYAVQIQNELESTKERKRLKKGGV